MEPGQPPNNKRSNIKDIARYSGLAMQMLATMLICVYLGYLFDRWTGWKFPVGIFSGMFIGLFAALYPVIKSTGNKN